MNDNDISTAPLTLAPARELTPAVWQLIENIAPAMYKSRLFGVTSPEAASAIMLKGYELGLGVTASFEFVQVIKGKPGLSPRGALALLHNAPEIESIKIDRLTDEKGAFLGYQCYMKRSNGFEHTASFTMEDANKAGLVKPDSGWAKYPENMCMWRAVGFCADVVAPDVTAGMTALLKTPEKFDMALTGDGEIIEMTPISTGNPGIDFALDPPTTLDELVAQYGAEAIMAANGDKIPGTTEEVQSIAEKLAKENG